MYIYIYLPTPSMTFPICTCWWFQAFKPPEKNKQWGSSPDGEKIRHICSTTKRIIISHCIPSCCIVYIYNLYPHENHEISPISMVEFPLLSLGGCILNFQHFAATLQQPLLRRVVLRFHLNLLAAGSRTGIRFIPNACKL